MSPVVLSHLDSIEWFHSFIFEDADARAPHICGLKLPDFEYSLEMDDSWFDRINDCLAALLGAATHLDSFDAEDLPKILTKLRSPLRYLHVEAHAPFNIPASFLHHHMAHFARTLEILELECLTFDISPPSVTTQFTALRSLKAKFVHNFHQLEVVLRLFPNLDNSLVLECLNTTLAKDAYPALRERNKEAQKVHPWPGLDRLVCDDDVAFLMALQCPIRHMDILHWVSLPDRKQFLVETLRHNPPRQLYSSISFFDGLDSSDGLFPLEAADTLTHLVISKHVPGDQFLDALSKSMQHLRLTHLRVVLHYHLRVHQDGAPMQTQLDLSRNLYTAGEGDRDLYRAAVRFFNSMPALQYLFLTTCGYVLTVNGNSSSCTCQRLSSQAWRAVGSAEDLHPSDAAERGPCQEISSEMAETVMDREELHLRSRDENFVRSCCDSASE
ncbi:hypothetical protein LXA43DRAFT_1101507 [Ganoderma leucocontextum]|nr:hypothetical protein LXA43DRAFT_1101507 [Ganoderma leucocontextum]